MRLKPIIAVFLGLLVLAAGCRTETMTGDQAVVYPGGRALKFKEDQIIKKQVQVTGEWQTITFEKPLQINREGVMGLHLAVDQQPYISTMDDHPLNPECNEPGCEINAFCLRRLSDGALVRPEAVLVGDNGVEVSVKPMGHLYPYCDKNIRTVILGTFVAGVDAPPRFSRGNKSLYRRAHPQYRTFPGQIFVVESGSSSGFVLAMNGLSDSLKTERGPRGGPAAYEMGVKPVEKGLLHFFKGFFFGRVVDNQFQSDQQPCQT